MEQHILNLLRENNRAILPDFGAFFIRQDDPKEIAFNSLLTFNDGMLIALICKSEGLSYDEAASKVENYTELLISELNKNKQVTIDQIGKIIIDESGEKKFTAWKDLGEKDATVTEDTKAIIAKNQKEQTEVKEEDKEAAVAVAAAVAEEEGKAAAVAAAEEEEKEAAVAAEDKEPNQEEKPFFTLDETLKEVDIDASGDFVKHIINEKDNGSVEPSRDPFTLDETREEEVETAAAAVAVEEEAGEAEVAAAAVEGEESASLQVRESSGPDDWESETEKHEPMVPPSSVSYYPQDRKKRKWILPLSITGSLIIIIFAAWFIFPDHVRNVFNTGKSTDEQIIPVEDNEILTEESQDIVTTTEPGLDEVGTTESTSQQQEASQVTERDIPSSAINTSRQKYYVVAGCFEYRENAEKYVGELQAKGYKAELFGTWKDLYAVSFNSFSTKDQALKEMFRIKQSDEPDAWVLYY